MRVAPSGGSRERAEERKRTIKRWFKDNMAFPNAVGVVDGLPFPFDLAPAYDSVAWNTRKCRYAMQCVIMKAGLHLFRLDILAPCTTPLPTKLPSSTSRLQLFFKMILHNFLRVGVNGELVDEEVVEEVQQWQRNPAHMQQQPAPPRDEQEAAADENDRRIGTARRERLKACVVANRFRVNKYKRA